MMHRLALYLGLVTLATAGAGCTAPPSPTTLLPPAAASSATSRTSGIPTTTPAPDPTVDLHSATAVAVAEVDATWTLNTHEDTGWYAGELRASAYMTPSYKAAIRSTPPLGSALGATWMTWAAHQVVTSVTTSVETDPGGPVDTGTAAYVQVAATVTPVGADGWVGSPQVWVTYLVLTRSTRSRPWQVSSTETTQ